MGVKQHTMIIYIRISSKVTNTSTGPTVKKISMERSTQPADVEVITRGGVTIRYDGMIP